MINSDLEMGQVQNSLGSGLTLTFDFGLGFNGFSTFQIFSGSVLVGLRKIIGLGSVFWVLRVLSKKKCLKMYIFSNFCRRVLNFFQFSGFIGFGFYNSYIF